MNSWRMKRLLEFITKGYKPYSNWFVKLRADDWAELLRFVDLHDYMDVGQWEHHLNRYWLEFEIRNKRKRPKNYIQVDEILANMNVKR